jgi:hypothetical protein
MKITSRGVLNRARPDRTNAFTPSASSSAPGTVTTNARNRWPNSSSGTPITATSSIASWVASSSSTSRGNRFSPPEMTISSSLPSTHSRPASSKWPTSPDDMRPRMTSFEPPPV